MPATAATSSTVPADIAWRVVGLLNLYRLLVPVVLVSALWLSGKPVSMVPHPSLFLAGCIAYFTAAVLLIVARRLRWSTLRLVAIVNASVDSAAIGFILYASGGVSSGFGILLVLPVLAMATLAKQRDALLIAAMAALAVLVQQFFVGLEAASGFAAYTTAGVLGVVLFVIAVLAWPLANRIRESEATLRRQEVDLANLAQLSQYIVQHLRESILVIDHQDRIRLINESAAQMLGDGKAYPDALLGEASPRLLFLLERWRQSTGDTGIFPATEQTFVGADGAQVIRAHFAPLGVSTPAPVLVFLEDTSLITEKVQQSKLAALGRLSASIAHEIRNPVGAMSHAGQLLAESPHLEPQERRLTEIIRNNADRVSGIIDSVLRLSRREEARVERLPLEAWSEEFHEEFCETMQWPRERLRVSGASAEIEVRVDPSQLRQIVWNLCENAVRYAYPDRETLGADSVIEIRCGRLASNGRPFLEVADRGPGVAREHMDRIFEPFFTGGRGTGLGLFLARELAQTNGATLLYEPRHGSGSVFRLVFADPRRWEVEH
ncbi:MAG: PAS domain-containing protein [Proteobacteria bacterium]|nr:PAS domain-containing protein [Pseudomonadota bacterium]